MMSSQILIDWRVRRHILGCGFGASLAFSVPAPAAAEDAESGASTASTASTASRGSTAPTTPSPPETLPPQAAPSPAPVPPAEVLVTGNTEVTSASESDVSGGQLMLRPRRRSEALIEAAPGLIAVQHSGGGKANQYFLRGFDIDHGTDLRFEVDGVPVNFPSHGHGQGYADLHFVIPETIARLKIHKGPYYAQFGDFATAGALEMEIADRLPEGQVSFSAGQYGILRGVALAPVVLGNDTAVLLGGELYAQDGPFENPERLQRVNLLGRVHHDLSPSVGATLSWMTYTGRWNASGQIPLREVEAGRLSRFGNIDPTEGGSTQRHSLSLKLNAEYDDMKFEADVFGILYDWRLYSNFTFFLNDPIRGDEIEQTDQRGVLGTHLRTSMETRLPWATLNTRVGIQVRADNIDNALYHDAARTRLETRASAGIAQTSFGMYVDELATFYPWLAVRAGVRVDRADASVEDRLNPPGSNAQSQGTADALLVSPKTSVLLSPLKWLHMFLNFGRGFHSNDARGATRMTDAADLLVAAAGYEVGVKTQIPEQLTVTAAVYLLDLDSEQVYVGDEGTTEPSDASRRYGVETTAMLSISRWLWADAAVTFNRAVYRANEGNGGAVALAPTVTASGGVSAKAPFGTFGSVRFRHIGARPATPDGQIQAQGWLVFNALLGHRYGPVEASLAIENLFDTAWREVQFATASRLQNEAQPVEEIHFAPGWPFTASGTLRLYY